MCLVAYLNISTSSTQVIFDTKEDVTQKEDIQIKYF